jgi:hypothetical protein
MVARREITGKKPRVTPTRAKRRTGPPQKIDPGAIEPTLSSEPNPNNVDDEANRIRGPPFAFSVAEFCRAHRISQAHYYELKRNGCGPDEMKIGRRRIVSTEAAARWRKAMEIAAEGAAE